MISIIIAINRNLFVLNISNFEPLNFSCERLIKKLTVCIFSQH